MPGSESWLDSITTSTTSPKGSSKSMKMSNRFSAETEAARTGILLPLSGIAIGVAPITGAGDDIQADRRADCFRQSEVSVPSDAKVSIKLVLRKIVKTGTRHTTRIIAQHTLKEALNKTHRTGSPPKPRRTIGKVATKPSATASNGLGCHSQAKPSQASA